MIKAISIYHTVKQFLTFFTRRHFPVYIVAQTVGAIAGAAVLHFASLEKWSLGVNGINPNTTPAGGFVMEALLTMLLVLVVYASAVDSGNNSSPMLPPLLIGLTVTVAHLLLIPFTGQSSPVITVCRSL